MTSNLNGPDTGGPSPFNEQVLQMLRGFSSQQQQAMLAQQIAALMAAANNSTTNNNNTLDKPNKPMKKLKVTAQNEKPQKRKQKPQKILQQEPKNIDNESITSLGQKLILDEEPSDVDSTNSILVDKYNYIKSENVEDDLMDQSDYLFDQQKQVMPKEAEEKERRRPAAIQELLQMKKARLNNSEKCSIKEHEEEDTPVAKSSEEAPDGFKEILQRLCNNQEEDAETTSSTHSCNSHQSESDNGKTMLSESWLSALQQNFNPSSSLNNLKSESVEPRLYLPPNRIPIRPNDNVTESALSSLIPHDRIFAKVPGRLSLLSNVVKYDLTVGEVKRRLMGPESYNFSLLGALLRRAKMPEKSQMLIGELEQVGLSIPKGRRKKIQITLLSALTETECVQLAKDFQHLTDTEFPSTLLAELNIKRRLQRESSYTSVEEKIMKIHSFRTSRKDQIESALKLIKEFKELLAEDRSPVMNMNPEPLFDSPIQDPLSTYSMLTHGFGNPGITVGVHTFETFLNDQLKFMYESKAFQNIVNSECVSGSGMNGCTVSKME